MKDNKKMSTLILVLVLMITAVISGTFAYWQWITSTEQETLVNVSLTDDATIYIDFPSNELTNLYPTSNCEANGTSSWVTDITVNNGTGVKLATNFKLKIKIEDKDGNVITNGTNEWNDHDFKYYVKFAVTEANESCKNALYTGRFDTNNLTYQNVATDDPHYSERTYWYDSSSITMEGDDGFPVVSSRIGSGVSFHALPNTSTSHTYKVWVWLDEEYTSVTVGEDSTLDKLQDAKITVSWSENSELEQIRESETPEGEAIAIYSEDDMSLRFYREKDPDSIGSTYNGRKVTEVYTVFETTGEHPWTESDYYKNIETIVFEDYIYPTSTAYWFSNTSISYLDVTKLDTTGCSYMFNYTSVENMVGIENWDISNVTAMEGMFSNFNIKHDLDLSSWDTSNVTNMGWMFYYASVDNIIGIESWDTSNVNSMVGMFQGVSSNLTLDLSGWNVCNVTDYSNFSTSSNIKKPYFGHGDACSGSLVVVGDAYAVYSEDDNSLRFYRSETPIAVGSTYNGRTVSSVFTDFENVETTMYPAWDYPTEHNVGDELPIGGVCGVDFEASDGICYLGPLSSYAETIVFEDYIYPVSTAYWFSYYNGSLDSSNLNKLDTRNVTIMRYMFQNANIINTVDLSGWNTSNVTNMEGMFSSAEITGTLDLSAWNVCRVTDHYYFADVTSGTILEPNWGMACP